MPTPLVTLCPQLLKGEMTQSASVSLGYHPGHCLHITFPAFTICGSAFVVGTSTSIEDTNCEGEPFIQTANGVSSDLR